MSVASFIKFGNLVFWDVADYAFSDKDFIIGRRSATTLEFLRQQPFSTHIYCLYTHIYKMGIKANK